jgi:DNA-binding LacI/PurR family transcriptional regulator
MFQSDRTPMTSGYKYRKIAESLRQRIKSGGLDAGSFLPTTKMLAKEFDTTTVTIDRAIGILVAEGMVIRTPGVGTIVQGAPERRPTPASSGLVGALLQAQTESRYWERLLEGVSDILRPAGLATLIGYHNQDENLALEHARLFRQQGVEIVLFAPFDRPDAISYEADNAVMVDRLHALGMQVIMLDRYIESVPGHFISEYCHTQGREMMEQLIDAGYRKPLCLSTDYVSVIGARERSFVEGCRSRGLEDGQQRIHRLPLKTYQSRDYDAVTALLAAHRDADLIVCLNSRIFNTLIFLLAKEGWGELHARRPKLAGFVDIELMDMDDVVAYVEQPIREMGHAAGRMVKQLLNEQLFEYLHALVPCELRMLDGQ